MKYHAKLIYSTTHYFWNLSKENIEAKLIIPFVNGQVKLVSNVTGKKLLNLSNVSELILYKTEDSLKISDDGKSIVKQMKEKAFEQNECTEELIKETKLENVSTQSLSLLQKTLLPEKNQVFVIMKFNDKQLDSAYEGVVKPVFEKYDIRVIRVDEMENSGKISDQILESISSSKYVFADLTGARPNCYYETGFAHAMGKEMILSCHKSETVHFDLSGYRFIGWETESELRKGLEKRIKSLLAQ